MVTGMSVTSTLIVIAPLPSWWKAVTQPLRTLWVSIYSNALLCLESVCFECHPHFNTLLSTITWICETVEGSSFPSMLRLHFPLSCLCRNKICSSLETPLVFWRVLSGVFPFAQYGMPAKPHLPIPKISWSVTLLRCTRFIATCQC